MPRIKFSLLLLVGRSIRLGIGLGVVYWILASAAGAYLLNEGSLASLALAPDRQQIWMRLPAVCFFVVFGAFAQLMAASRKRAGEAFQQTHEAPEERVAQRTAELSADNERLRLEFTGRKRVAEALRERELWMQTLFDCLEEAVFVVTPDRRLIDFNAAAEKMFGYSKEEVAELSTEVLHVDHEHYLEFGRRIQESFKSGKVAEFEFQVRRKNGEVFPTEHSVSPLKRGGGEPIGIISVVRDITARKRAEQAMQDAHDRLGLRVHERTAELARANEQLRTEITERRQAEEALRASEQRYRVLLENLPQKIFLKDRNSVYVSCNENYARDLKIKPQEILGKTDYEFYPKGLAEKYRADDQRIAASGETEDIEEQYVQNGREIIVHTVKTPVRDSDGKVMGVLGIFWDITKRKRAEEALRDRTESLTERLKELHCLYSLSHLVEAPGISLEEILQGSVDLLPAGLQYPDVVCVRLVIGDRAYRTEDYQDTAWKVSRDILVSGRAAGTLEVCYLEGRPQADKGRFLQEERDLIAAIAERLGRIIERKRAEEQGQQHRAELAHVSRLSTLGEMASALAHELIQPLSAIVNYNEACMEGLRSGAATVDQLLHDMAQISAQAQRAGGIIRRTRNLVQKGKLRRTRMDLNAVVREVADLQGPEARQEGVTIHLELADQLEALQADLIQIEQVILNLVRNAIEAMTDTAVERRILTIETSMAGAEAVEVAVRDTGRGLPADRADRLFDPFFTTKPDGLGLGLSISQSIVDAHGGRLWATPNPDRGTTFRLMLPIAEANDAR